MASSIDHECRLRRQISHQLHDGPLQKIVGSKLMLEALAAKLEAAGTYPANAFAPVLELLQQSICETRQILMDFRPLVPNTSRSTWVDALRCWLPSVSRTTKLELQIADGAASIPCDWQETVYRVVSESLINALNHSRASRIAVKASNCDDCLSIEVSDDGIGFDHAKVPNDHFGLRAMSERITALGGSVQVDSTEGKGTRICVSVPLPPSP